MPTNKSLIKLHKGTDNRLNFRVRNTDLKLVELGAMTIKAKIINRHNNEKVLEKYLTIASPKGIAILEVLEGDIMDIAPGFYELVLINEDSTVTGQADYYSQSAFYTDEADNISFSVEVTAQGDSLPQPTVELLQADFRPRRDREFRLVYDTNPVPCNALRNHKNSNHTFALYCEDFSGKVEVYGSLDLSPPDSFGNFFPLEIAPGSTSITFEDHTGVEAFNFSANLVWAKFVITPDVLLDKEQGKITKILWRS